LAPKVVMLRNTTSFAKIFWDLTAFFSKSWFGAAGSKAQTCLLEVKAFFFFLFVHQTKQHNTTNNTTITSKSLKFCKSSSLINIDFQCF
jgi:uncharacterized membrane protein